MQAFLCRSHHATKSIFQRTNTVAKNQRKAVTLSPYYGSATSRWFSDEAAEVLHRNIGISAHIDR